MFLKYPPRLDPALADFLDETVIPLLRYVFPRGIIRNLSNRAIEASADYAYNNMGHSLAFKRLEDLRQFAFQSRRPEGLIVEFGVYRGTSINFLSERTTDKVYGFDSFRGLKEDWRGTNLTKGHFDLEGRLPMVRGNVELIPGWFDETLPSFLGSNTAAFSFVHIDSDTYEAARTILSIAGERFVSGTVVLFDEYFGYRGWEYGEFKAWKDFVADKGLKYEYLAFSNDGVAVKLL